VTYAERFRVKFGDVPMSGTDRNDRNGTRKSEDYYRAPLTKTTERVSVSNVSDGTQVYPSFSGPANSVRFKCGSADLVTLTHYRACNECKRQWVVWDAPPSKFAAQEGNRTLLAPTLATKTL
jgi:hypothetical protein